MNLEFSMKIQIRLFQGDSRFILVLKAFLFIFSVVRWMTAFSLPQFREKIPIFVRNRRFVVFLWRSMSDDPFLCTVPYGRNVMGI